MLYLLDFSEFWNLSPPPHFGASRIEPHRSSFFFAPSSSGLCSFQVSFAVVGQSPISNLQYRISIQYRIKRNDILGHLGTLVGTVYLSWLFPVVGFYESDVWIRARFLILQKRVRFLRVETVDWDCIGYADSS